MDIILAHSDNIEALKKLPENSIDSIVTDPPYGLSFMGKRWDYDVPSVEFWAAALRVLKPGGHVVSFSSARTYHRMVVNIEDAGFEIRDQLAWVYGSGFPKNHDVSKSIDKAAGATREVIGFDASRVRENRQYKSGAIGNVGGHEKASDRSDNGATITAPATEEAKKWSGWGTALKPSMEPICLARKPLTGTVAANVLQHGVGAINIDGCRVGMSQSDFDKTARTGSYGATTKGSIGFNNSKITPMRAPVNTGGRHPATFLHDGSEEVLSCFPSKAGGEDNRVHAGGSRPGGFGNVGADKGDGKPCGPLYSDSGSPARFFYCAKASKDDRAGSKHPTVKPVELMRWLCRLVTPPGGTLLDPFAGSGTTGAAARLEGFNAILIELEPEYVADIERRLGIKAQPVLSP